MKSDLTVVSLYHFSEISDLVVKQKELLNRCRELSILGTFIIAKEGINGTICGDKESIEQVIYLILSWPEIEDMELKYSTAAKQNFNRMRVRIKKEIVTMGLRDVDPTQKRGKYVDPLDWNDVISSDDVLVIDTRNKYETDIGRFKNSVDPDTNSFSEFPDWAMQLFDRLNTSPGELPKIAMYCTGGIRCEKASSLMLDIGFPEVFHLKGGILKYLEPTPRSESLWEGECFVFDERVSLNHGLIEGDYSLCYSCQSPLSPEDRESIYYEEGVRCHLCHDVIKDSKLKGARERQRQIQISRSKGEQHIGDYSVSRKRFENTN